MAKVNSQVQYKFIIELNDKEAISLYNLIKEYGGAFQGENRNLYDNLYVKLLNLNLV